MNGIEKVGNYESQLCNCYKKVTDLISVREPRSEFLRSVSSLFCPGLTTQMMDVNDSSLLGKFSSM